MFISSLVLLVSIKSLALSPQQRDYLTVASVSIQEIPDLSPLSGKLEVQQMASDYKNVSPSVDLTQLAGLADPIKEFDIQLDAIINIGQKIWTIAEKGRPVVSASLNSASAMPEGITKWTQLEGWKPTRSASYEVVYTNIYGMKVVSFAYRVMFTYGGSFKEQGRYVTNATIVPASLDVAWGYSFKSTVEIPTVVNTGTQSQPIGGIQMNVNWTVGTVLKHSEMRTSFFVDGLGNLNQLD